MRKLGEAPRIPGRLENQSGIKEQGNWAKHMPVDVCLGYPDCEEPLTHLHHCCTQPGI